MTQEVLMHSGSPSPDSDCGCYQQSRLQQRLQAPRHSLAVPPGWHKARTLGTNRPVPSWWRRGGTQPPRLTWQHRPVTSPSASLKISQEKQMLPPPSYNTLNAPGATPARTRGAMEMLEARNQSCILTRLQFTCQEAEPAVGRADFQHS